MASLEQTVRNILEGQLETYTLKEAQSWILDLQRYGCISGMVSDLIYYKDTVAFFDQHEDEILNLAKTFEFSADPVKVGMTGFKNTMAWFAFETLAPIIIERIKHERPNNLEQY
ncbi:MAG: hypothetical protein JJ975_05945 [Bacteroidia bacterium]|nr:hypothetical protein [Bacteroidia bacterium]